MFPSGCFYNFFQLKVPIMGSRDMHELKGQTNQASAKANLVVQNWQLLKRDKKKF